jgi:hypothetical protein
MTRPPSALWLEIQSNAPRLMTRRAAVFLRYCRQQANKYGIKASRVSAARQALACLLDAEAKYGTAAKLAVAEIELEAAIDTSEHAMLIDLPTPADTLVRHFDGLRQENALHQVDQECSGDRATTGERLWSAGTSGRTKRRN